MVGSLGHRTKRNRLKLLASGGLFGGAEQDRTVDLLIANAKLNDKARSGDTA
jgi:hypothetical protein